jgi:TolA-binding protein
VYPVQFKFLNADTKAELSAWLQGFTSDIGRGGICLQVHKLSPAFIPLLKEGRSIIALELELPITRRPVQAKSTISWFKMREEEPEICLIGLNYSEIDPPDNNKIMRFVRAKKIFLPLLIVTIVLLAAGLAVDSYFNIRLIRGNRVLVEQLLEVLEDYRVAKEKTKDIAREKDGLSAGLKILQGQISVLEKERRLTQAKESKLQELNFQIEKLSRERGGLQEKLMSVKDKEDALSEELLRLDEKKIVLEKANFAKMYQWLAIHQNGRTGLVASFEGDADIAGWAFTYDQALVVQAYSIFSDFARAKKTLDFFNRRAKRVNGLFVNAYYVSDGLPAEYIIHSGPNLWLGIAALQYAKKSKDVSYLELARDIARGIMHLQGEDPEGGLRGGPQVQWYSTEHNLDAYAFFNILFELTKEQQYKDAAQAILNWLVKYSYARQQLPIKRGKGDSTIATDTYAWSIAAIGPQKLEELGMAPDKILEFAESTCVVEVDYQRPEGQVLKIKGFDFAPRQHLARGGVVSTEWTAQMILAFKLMARYYAQKGMFAKAQVYALKADEYLAQLANLVISSPSPSGQGEGCLPYASEENVDTGHGWVTPQGKSTGSIAGTACALLAYYNYNPLELQE